MRRKERTREMTEEIKRPPTTVLPLPNSTAAHLHLEPGHVVCILYLSAQLRSPQPYFQVLYLGEIDWGKGFRAVMIDV